ncbi:MAG TPA: glutathione S-transferase family protein [Caulobacteraceae bacterium]
MAPYNARMALKLYAHPFSSYCQKALIGFYENDIPFDLVLPHDEAGALNPEFAALWPIGRFPVLKDGERVIPEATIILEYLAVHYPGPVKLVPADPAAAIEVRLMDRFFDNYVSNPQSAIVFNAIRPEESRDPYGVDQQRAMLDKAYAWLDGRMAGRTWAACDDFSLADAAAAPALLYADWTHPIPRSFEHLWAYRDRLLERPSYALALNEARPFRHFFPLGAPEGRD